MTGLFLIGVIIYVLVRVGKEASDDAWMREQARKDGSSFYYSSTGCRDTKTRKPTTPWQSK